MTTLSSHEPRLTRALRSLLFTQRVADLGTLCDEGRPFVSMVPYAIETESACLVIHVSALAAHTAHLRQRPNVALLVRATEVAKEPVHALPRVSLDGLARTLEPGSTSWSACRTAYLLRFPDAVLMTELPDFSFIAISVLRARQVAGFGAARSLDADAMRQVLSVLPAD